MIATHVGLGVSRPSSEHLFLVIASPAGGYFAGHGAGVRPVSVSLSHVAARQELRALMQAVGLHDDKAAKEEPSTEVDDEAEELDKAS